MQHWVVIPEEYLNYLRKIENRIPYSNYGADKYKPFFGELFTIGDLVYVTQISHAQPRHANLKNSKDFVKIYLPNADREQADRLVAVVNLNYMFPIPKSIITPLEYKTIDQHRTFLSQKDKTQYIDLLKKELSVINTLNIDRKAKTLYDLKINFPNDVISKRCFEFLRLEELANSYQYASIT